MSGDSLLKRLAADAHAERLAREAMEKAARRVREEMEERQRIQEKQERQRRYRQEDLITSQVEKVLRWFKTTSFPELIQALMTEVLSADIRSFVLETYGVHLTDGRGLRPDGIHVVTQPDEDWSKKLRPSLWGLGNPEIDDSSVFDFLEIRIVFCVPQGIKRYSFQFEITSNGVMSICADSHSSPKIEMSVREWSASPQSQEDAIYELCRVAPIFQSSYKSPEPRWEDLKGQY